MLNNPVLDKTHSFDLGGSKNEKTRFDTTKALLWQQKAKLCEIQPIYKYSSIENCPLLPKEIVEFGKKWLNSRSRPSLYIRGNTGSGKTYFSIALFRFLVEEAHPWLIFAKSDQMDEELLNAVQEKQEKTKIMKYKETPFLFIDDLGVERVSERIDRQYYSIIDHRVGNGLTTVITSNIPKNELPMGQRLISRLEHFYEIEFPNVDLRKTLDLPLL